MISVKSIRLPERSDAVRAPVNLSYEFLPSQVKQGANRVIERLHSDGALESFEFGESGAGDSHGGLRRRHGGCCMQHAVYNVNVVGER